MVARDWNLLEPSLHLEWTTGRTDYKNSLCFKIAITSILQRRIREILKGYLLNITLGLTLRA